MFGIFTHSQKISDSITNLEKLQSRLNDIEKDIGVIRNSILQERYSSNLGGHYNRLNLKGDGNYLFLTDGYIGEVSQNRLDSGNFKYNRKEFLCPGNLMNKGDEFVVKEGKLSIIKYRGRDWNGEADDLRRINCISGKILKIK